MGLTADDYIRRAEWPDWELHDGELSPVHCSASASVVSVGLVSRLGEVVGRLQRHGHLFGPKCPYRCFPGRPDHVRRVSASFVRPGRLPGEVVPDLFMTIPPDLAAIVVTPFDLYESVQVGVEDWLSAGVPLVWVVSPGSRTVQVRRADGTMNVIDESGTLSGEAVVPGFACQVADLFV